MLSGRARRADNPRRDLVGRNSGNVLSSGARGLSAHRSLMQSRSLLSSFFWTLAGRLSAQASGLVMAALVNRALNPGGRGSLAGIQAWVGLFAALFGFSLDTAIYHFANREKYPYADSTRLALVLVATTCTCVMAAGGFAALTIIWPEQVSGEAAAHLFWVLVLLVTTIAGTNLIAFGQALGRVQLAAGMGIAQAVINVGLVVPAYVYHAIDLRYALLVSFLVQFAGLFLGATVLLHAYRPSFSGVTWAGLWTLVGAGLRYHTGTVACFAYTKLNQLTVQHHCGDIQTGLLAVALTLSFGLFGIFGAFQMALYPRVIHSADDFSITVRSMRLTFYAGLVVVLPLIVLSRYILRFYGGGQFEGAVWMLRMLVPAAWMMTISGLAAPYCVKSGAFGLTSASAVALGVISVIASHFLVPLFRGEGAAAATLLTLATGTIMTLGMLRWLGGRSPLGMFIPDFRDEWRFVRTLLTRTRTPQPTGS